MGRGLLMLLLVATAIANVQAAQCAYTKSTSCPWYKFWEWWKTCTRTAYRYCVHGGWSGWREQSRTSCTRTCGGGTFVSTQTRSCNNPVPSGGGNSCSGVSSKHITVSCNTHSCPIDGGWSDWGDWEDSSQCTVTCGGGQKTQSRDRSCTNPQPQYGGRACVGDNTEQRTVGCNTQECPIDGGWSDWGDWEDSSQCTVTCGGGQKTQSRDRSCTNPQPQYGGLACAGDDTEEKSISCNTNECPIDGGWSDWGDWEDTNKCTVMCGGGEKNQSRDRSCTNPQPQFGGRDCDGENTQNRTVTCNADECGSLCPTGENTFIADTDDEGYYYHCQQGDNSTVTTKAVLRQCPAGTTWNQAMKTCGHQADDTPTTPSPAPAPAPTCTDSTSRADPDDCTFYLQCLGGNEIRRACGTGTKFDNSIGMCNTASLVTC